jgi:hypothetical protein
MRALPSLSAALRGLALPAFVALATSGCFGSNYRSSYTMMDVQAKPASLMVAQKIQRPLILVLDPAKVADTVDLQVASSFNPKDGPQFKLLNFHRFVDRDLKAAFGSYFSRVEVVQAGAPMPSEPHVVADVKVDRVQLHSVPAGGLTYVIIEMTWGLGLRPSESKEYTFTFAGEAKSSETYPTFEAGVGQLVESAILGFNKGLVEKGALEALQKASAAPAKR